MVSISRKLCFTNLWEQPGRLATTPLAKSMQRQRWTNLCSRSGVHIQKRSFTAYLEAQPAPKNNIDQGCIMKLHPKACMALKVAALPIVQDIRPKGAKARAGHQFCACQPQQQSDADVCCEVLATSKLVGSSGTAPCSGRGPSNASPVRQDTHHSTQPISRQTAL